MRNVFGILFYIAAGFLVYTMSFMGFIASDASLAYYAKFVAIGIFTILAIIPFSIGLLIRGCRKWKQDLGVILISGGGAGGVWY